MSGFALPRVAVPARLLLTHGEARTGQIYVMERVPHHTGPETPLEMLNRPEGFFPFRPGGDGGVLLVAKAQTMSLAVADRDLPAELADPDRRSAARLVRLEVVLADGSALAGWANAELPEHHARPLDYLNASRDPFFAVSTDEVTHHVNRTHVLFARPRD